MKPFYKYEPFKNHFFKTCIVLLVGGPLLSGCNSIGNSLGSQPAISAYNFEALSDKERQNLAQAYQQQPKSRRLALAYAASLKATGQSAQAVAVLEKLTIHYPEDKEVLSAFGKSLIDVGRASQAEEVLGNAHAPDQPDWTILSAQGVAADQQNDHQRAQGFYKAALAIMPNEPSILTNMGLSYALSGDLVEAEKKLRLAVDSQQASVMTRKNLAMVLALRGKPAEAKTIVAQDMPANEVDRFISQFKRGK